VHAWGSKQMSGELGDSNTSPQPPEKRWISGGEQPGWAGLLRSCGWFPFGAGLMETFSALSFCLGCAAPRTDLG